MRAEEWSSPNLNWSFALLSRSGLISLSFVSMVTSPPHKKRNQRGMISPAREGGGTGGIMWRVVLISMFLFAPFSSGQDSCPYPITSSLTCSTDEPKCSHTVPVRNCSGPKSASSCNPEAGFRWCCNDQVWMAGPGGPCNGGPGTQSLTEIASADKLTRMRLLLPTCNGSFVAAGGKHSTDPVAR